MTKRVFVSFNFNDKAVSDRVKLMLKAIGENTSVKWVWVENDVSYNGDTAIAWELEQLMSDCDCALFIIGDNPRTSPWLDKEASLAIARELSVICTILPEMSAQLPEFSKRLDCPVVSWHNEELADAIEQSVSYV